MKRTIYFYRYTTNPEAIKQYGSNFIVFKDKIIEETDKQYILDSTYSYIRKEMVDNPNEMWNESTNRDINYTWFSMNNNKTNMKIFKKMVKERLIECERKIQDELNYMHQLIIGIISEE